MFDDKGKGKARLSKHSTFPEFPENVHIEQVTRAVKRLRMITTKNTRILEVSKNCMNL